MQSMANSALIGTGSHLVKGSGFCVSATRRPAKQGHQNSQDSLRRRQRQMAVRAKREPEEEAPRVKGIFEFVTDNPSSKGAIQLKNTPAQDGNLGQMIAAIEDKGRDFGSIIESGDFQWFVREVGSQTDPVVVFLHGAPAPSYSFRQVMTQLAAKGYFCVAPDWIGFGFSEMPQPGYGFEYTEDAYHAALDILLQDLGIDQPFCLVVSGFFTGSYALTWAAANQNRLARLAILNTPLTPSSSLPLPLQQLRFPFVGEFACQNAVLAERFIEAGSPYRLELDDADVYRLPYLNSGSPGFALLEVARKFKSGDVARRIQDGFAAKTWSIPTVVPWGKEDPYLPVSEATTFAGNNPSVIRLDVLEGAGHLPQEDWAEKVVESLVSTFK